MRRTGSILVVDNEPTIVDLLVDIMTYEGYVVCSAPDSVQALAMIALQAPALILLDVRMPGMAGAELLEQVREADLATLSIVLMTTAPRYIAPLLARGARECLAKPFELDDLLACVARYVQPAQVASQLVFAN